MEYKTISIRKVIKMINDKEMYLPEIQRGFVWKEKQVEKLFESIFVGYPIGSLLFWETALGGCRLHPSQRHRRSEVCL